MKHYTLNFSDKGSLRRQVLAAREKLDAVARRNAVERTLPKLAALPGYRGANKVAAYMSFGSEIETGPFVEMVLADHKILILPRVDKALHRLTLHHVFERDKLVKGPWGIHEPAPDWPRAMMGDIDFMLVPGVAFDRRGNRIGYGAGFYDRLLAQRSRRTDCVAVAFDCQVVDHIPCDAHDQAIDRLITESHNDEFFS